MSSVPAVELLGRVKVMLPLATVATLPFWTRANPPTVPVADAVSVARVAPPAGVVAVPDAVSDASVTLPTQEGWVAKFDRVICPSAPGPLFSPFAPRAPPPPPGPVVGGE